MLTSRSSRANMPVRSALLLGCAMTAAAAGSQPVFAMAGSPVPVGCVAPDNPGNVLNCTGNLSAGVTFAMVSPLFDTGLTMNVYDVTKDISPDGAPGIALANAFGSTTINSNLGSHQIITTDGLPGIIGFGLSVTITHTGNIVASGYGSYGIFAMGSLDASFAPASPQPNYTSAVSITSTGDITVGPSGAGVVGYATTGNVVVTSTGNITGGHNSSGIIAANNGPDSKFGTLGIGDVTVVSKGNITLTEDGATQTGDTSELSGFVPPYLAGIVAYNGGTGNVNVTSTGNISTTGQGRYGIDAYSAGLALGSTVTVTSKGNITTKGKDAGAISAIGEFANVTITSEGNISTSGQWASGLRATSSGAVNVTNKGDITATGTGSYGIYATAEPCSFCEFPPGGPAAGPDTKIDITSTGDINVGKLGAGIAASAVTGDVTVTSTGNIKGGAGSSGIIAATNTPDSQLGILGPGTLSIESTGNITLNDDRANQSGDSSFLADSLPPYSAGIVAYNGGTGSTFVHSTGNISTTGDGRNGIDAYSGGFALFEVLSVVSIGNVSTTGNRATGISAESDYADVAVVSRGNIVTKGQSSDGIYAASASGGFVDVVNEGNITTPGGDAYGIMVAGYNDLTVTNKSGTVMGGLASVVFFAGKENLLTNRGTITAGVEGVAVEGDIIGAEQIDNHGTINGSVRLATDPGDDWPDEEHAGIATDGIHNFAGATFNSGSSVQLGNTGVLLNEGTLNAGGSGVVATTKLEGRLEQAASGVVGVDIAGATADRIDISSTAPAITNQAPAKANLPSAQILAVMEGRIAPHIVSFDASKSTQQFTIMTSTGTIAANGLTVTDTALVDYSLLYPNASEIVLQLDAHFSAAGLTPNQNALLGYLGRQIGTPGGDALQDIYANLLNAPDTTSLGALADQLNTGAGSSAFNGWLAGDAFAQALRSCPVAEGPYGQLRETSCVWARAGAREFNQQAGTDRADVNSNSSGIMGGIQTQLAEHVWAGAGFSLEDTAATVDHRTQADTRWWQGGAVVKWAEGAWKLSGSVSGGQGQVDMTRLTGTPALSATATSGTDVTLVTSLARLAYSFGAEGFYVTPMVDASATYVKMDGFTESGAGLFNLAASSADQWIFAAGPAVEIGATYTTGGMTLRPFIKTGVTFLSDDSFDIQARFASLPASAGSFDVHSRFDDVLATLDAGVQLFSVDGINLKLDYQGRYGADSFQNGVDAKLTVNY